MKHLVLATATLARVRLQRVVKLQVVAPASEVKAVELFRFIESVNEAYEVATGFLILCVEQGRNQQNGGRD
jgi:hypothetical protein